MEDVKAFLEIIANEIDNFTPSANFTNYVYPETHMRRYTDEEAQIRNDNLDKCIAVCEICTEGSLEYIEWFYDLQLLCIEHEHGIELMITFTI